jgi:hypothetical protein
MEEMTQPIDLNKVQKLLDALDAAYEQQGNFHPVDASVFWREMFRVQRSLYLAKTRNTSYTEDEKYSLVESLIGAFRES